MIEFRPGEWEGLDGIGEEELAKLRAGAELAIDRAGLALENEVKRTLGPDGGPRTGRIYIVPASNAAGAGTRGRPRKNAPRHQASAPGEPPAWLYGDLARSITHSAPAWDGWIVSTEVGTALEKARRLEWGGVDSRGIRILPRPYFAPSVLRAEPTIERILEESVKS
jgi:hypothetical protein